MRVPASVFIAQSVLVGSLGILTVVLYRQLAFLVRGLGRIDKQASGGLPVGSPAPQFEYDNLQSRAQLTATFAEQRWTLLAFLDPLCVTCDDALTSIERITKHSLAGFRILVVSTAAPRLIGAVQAFANTSLELGHVSAEVATDLYRTDATPFLYVIDPAGVIRAKGAASSEASLYELLDAATKTPSTRPATATIQLVSVGGRPDERNH
jgi:hypothetical protein